jgi:hypothetical protein
LGLKAPVGKRHLDPKVDQASCQLRF